MRTESTSTKPGHPGGTHYKHDHTFMVHFHQQRVPKSYTLKHIACFTHIRTHQTNKKSSHQGLSLEYTMHNNVPRDPTWASSVVARLLLLLLQRTCQNFFCFFVLAADSKALKPCCVHTRCDPILLATGRPPCTAGQAVCNTGGHGDETCCLDRIGLGRLGVSVRVLTCAPLPDWTDVPV
jgi:hypothetical protein